MKTTLPISKHDAHRLNHAPVECVPHEDIFNDFAQHHLPEGFYSITSHCGERLYRLVN